MKKRFFQILPIISISLLCIVTAKCSEYGKASDIREEELQRWINHTRGIPTEWTDTDARNYAYQKQKVQEERNRIISEIKSYQPNSTNKTSSDVETEVSGWVKIRIPLEPTLPVEKIMPEKKDKK